MPSARPCRWRAAQAVVARGRAAQAAWAALPLAARIDTVMAGIAALEAMAPDIVPELAWQMGRPVRYGGEFGGVRERAAYMAQIAPTALADEVVEDSDSLPAFWRARRRAWFL
jgi:acyl-CoA reductase-like NAD-dependent aldehyde dehydrogenase